MEGHDTQSPQQGTYWLIDLLINGQMVIIAKMLNEHLNKYS